MGGDLYIFEIVETILWDICLFLLNFTFFVWVGRCWGLGSLRRILFLGEVLFLRDVTKLRFGVVDFACWVVFRNFS